jgi:hypothetical protein
MSNRTFGIKLPTQRHSLTFRERIKAASKVVARRLANPKFLEDNPYTQRRKP